MDNVMAPGDDAVRGDAFGLLKEMAGRVPWKEAQGFLVSWYFLGGEQLEQVMGEDDFREMLALCHSQGVHPEELGPGRFPAGDGGATGEAALCYSATVGPSMKGH